MSAATASVEVPCDPGTAFAIFTEDIGSWWKRGTNYWNDAARGLEYRLEPGVGGRLLEVYEQGSCEIGRVLVWEPGQLLVLTWRQEDWPPKKYTEVEVKFEKIRNGTLVTVEHSGWDQIPANGAGYSHGWAELLGFYAAKTQKAEAR